MSPMEAMNMDWKYAVRVGRIVDDDDEALNEHGQSADETFVQQGERRRSSQIHQEQSSERQEIDDSYHQRSIGMLSPDFRLNAPLPNEGEDEVTPTPPTVEPVVMARQTSNSDEPTRSVPYAHAGGPVTTKPIKEEVEVEQDSKNNRGAFQFQIWVQRHWKLATFTIVLLSALLLAAVIVIIVLALNQSSGSGGSGANSATTTTPTMIETIQARGTLNCGVVQYPGLSMLDNKTGSWSGFEVDLCRAIGVAIFGEDGQVRFTASTYSERFSLLQSKQVDLLAAGATYTMERDLFEPSAGAGFTFSVPYLYDGVSFAGVPQYVACAEQRITTGNCSKISICVQDSTSHVPVIESLFPNLSVVVLAPSNFDFYNNFVKGLCNVLAGEQFDLAKINVLQAGYNGGYGFSSNFYSKEPIALVTRDDDASWSDFVNWVFLALLTAEKQSITQATAQTTVMSPGPAVDLSQLPFYRAVATVGNYAEMYENHLNAIVPRAPVNQLNNGSTPLIYSFPFGNNTTLGPGPMNTLNTILDRGYLLCGTAETPFFADFNLTAQQWQGFDVDYCRAVSAAIFNGIGSTVFVHVTDTNRWEVLQNGEIDILSWDSTWNYERDVLEPSTNTGFTFAQADFYTGLQLGGIPPYFACAEGLNLQNQCAGLKICVKDGTTTIDDLWKLFVNQSIVPRANDQQVVDCLRNGVGNVIAADGFFTAAATVKEMGYTGTYQTSTRLFSGESLAVVTRQGDPQWSSFVNWVVFATFYAAEQNITQATQQSMPTTNLFGQNFTAMFQNAILAVGSHSEILARNTVGKYNLSAINQLNTNPYSPQHFPPGGLFSNY